MLLFYLLPHLQDSELIFYLDTVGRSGEATFYMLTFVLRALGAIIQLGSSTAGTNSRCLGDPRLHLRRNASHTAKPQCSLLQMAETRSLGEFCFRERALC